MNEPICMVEIQMDYDKVLDDDEYNTEEMKDCIINHFSAIHQTTAELKEDNTIIVTVYDESEFATCFIYIEALYKKDWFKRYVKSYRFYECDEMRAEGDSYIPDDILEPFNCYGI